MIEPLDITCVVPTHNRPEYLRRALHSLSGQTMKPTRIVVSDNGDHATTEKVISEFSESLEIVHLKSPIDLPAFENWKAGINYVESEFIKIVWDDDWLRDDCLETMTRWQRFYKTDTVLCGAIGVIGESTYTWYQYPEFYSDSLIECFPLITRRILPNSPLAALVRSEHLKYAVNEIRYPNKCISENLVVGPDMAMNFVSLFIGGNIYFNPEPLVFMFGDGLNMTMKYQNTLPNIYRKSFKALCNQHSFSYSLNERILVISMGNDIPAFLSKIVLRLLKKS